MSLVICTITDTFALMGAEKRGILGDIIKENVNKLIKVNKNIIFGCTGGIKDNYTLFDEFCGYSDDCGLYNLESPIDISYHDFIDLISRRFSYMQNIHNDMSNPRKYNIQSLVCGFNGNCFEITCFNLTEDVSIPQGIVKAVKAPDFPYKGAVAGKPMHIEVMHNLVYQRQPSNVLQYKNIIKDVIDQGTLVDDTINTNYHFEKIRLKDVIND